MHVDNLALRRYLGGALAAVLAVFGLVMLRPGAAMASSYQYQLDPGEQLGIENYIGSADHTYWLTIKDNGDVRESQIGSDLTIATTHTGSPGSILRMQEDGNLVVIAPGNVPVWASGTDGHPGTVLQIQNDGALILYAPGHRVLRVLVPALFDSANSVPTPHLMPLPTAEAEGVEPSEVTQAVYDGSRVVGCATAGKLVEKASEGEVKAAGVAEEQLCGMVTKTKGAKLDGYGVFRLGSTVALSFISAPVAVGWDILSEPEAAY